MTLPIALSASTAFHSQIQVPFHVGFHDDVLNDFGRKHKIVLQAYSPLGGGLLAKNNTASPTGQAISDIAIRLNRSVAQVALRFVLQRGATIIPKASNVTYQTENLDLFDFSLTDRDMHQSVIHTLLLL